LGFEISKPDKYVEQVSVPYIEMFSNVQMFRDFCRTIVTPDSQFLKDLDRKVTLNDLTMKVDNILTVFKNIESKYDIIDERFSRLEKSLNIDIESEDDVIEIKDYTYDEAKKIIEDYLIEEDREVDPFEIITKFSIDIHLVQKIYTDLVNEGKAE